MARRRLAVGGSVHHPAQRLRPLDPAWAVAAPGQDWRLACGDAVLPAAVVADSRSLRSAPTAWTRGIDGGKLIKGVKLFAICDKHGSLFDLELGPANTDDRMGSLPILPRLAALGFQGDLLGDSGFTGAPFATAALAYDIHVSVAPGGTRDGLSCPAESGGWWNASSPG
jgi:Transposase DDE domain